MVNASGIDNGFPLTYQTFHSVETALLSVQDDILNSMGQGKITALITLLDLSAAFDTIYHTILLDRLQDLFGIDVVALMWIVSYPTGMCQTINIQGKLSLHMALIYGVTQGLLWPPIFNLYTILKTTIPTCYHHSSKCPGQQKA